MPLYDDILFIKRTVQKKLSCCAKSFIEQEVLNAQLNAICEKIDKIEVIINNFCSSSDHKKKAKKDT